MRTRLVRSLPIAVAVCTIAVLGACSSESSSSAPDGSATTIPSTPTSGSPSSGAVKAGWDNPEVPGAPSPPAPEAVVVERLPLPPTIASDEVGACTDALNPNGTGCISNVSEGGGYIDPSNVVAVVNFVGAPAPPDPASVYAGDQLIVVKTDGTEFSTGDPWKCLTCGIPDTNQQGRSAGDSYPQPFNDGMRILIGANVLDCSPHRLLDDACTPAATHIYPIRWDSKAEGNGSNIRELRINPDDTHIGFNHVALDGPKFDQFGYYGRLEFDPDPPAGTTPAVPRYDIVNVTGMYESDADRQPVYEDPEHPGEILVNQMTRSIGEFRGWTKDGREAVAITYPSESDNIDVFAIDLFTGEERRLTANPEYVDPIDMAPDGNGGVYEDTRGSDRQMFLAAMRGIPALNDLVTTGAVSSVRNAGERRFFQPYLIDAYGDRGTYNGQQLNPGDTEPGGLGDPNWNARADPRWSPDGTSIVYRQAAAPGATSEEPQGRTTRFVIARLTDRQPYDYQKPDTLPDEIGWGTPYTPGDPDPVRPLAPAGTFTLRGRSSGSATVTISHTADDLLVSKVEVDYVDYSDDGIHIINGTESTERLPDSTQTLTKTLWHSDLTLSGEHQGTKVTSEPDGYVLTIDILENELTQTGTLTTTIDGTTYTQPNNGE